LTWKKANDSFFNWNIDTEHPKQGKFINESKTK
jgi:hypothetical protein